MIKEIAYTNMLQPTFYMTAGGNIAIAFLSNGYTMTNRVPKDSIEFIECYKLLQNSPKLISGLKILAKNFVTWQNISHFWQELYHVAISDSYDFELFLNAVTNIPYEHMGYIDFINRRKLGVAVYKKYDFTGKRIPNTAFINCSIVKNAKDCV